jgi:hypothetical protein
MHSYTILDLGIGCRWVVSFMLRPLYSRGRRPRYLFDRGIIGPYNRSGSCGEEKNLPLRGTEPRTSSPLPHHYTNWATPTPDCTLRPPLPNREGGDECSAWRWWKYQSLSAWREFEPIFSRQKMLVCSGSVHISPATVCYWLELPTSSENIL